MRKTLLIATVLAIAALIVPLLTTGNHTRHERRDHRCGPSFNCTPCNNDRCCSVFSYCGGGDDYCDPYTCAYQCGFDTPPCMPSVNVTTFGFEEENDAAYNGSATVRCEPTRSNVSTSWIREHGRRLFCNLTDVSCGECLKVTNNKGETHTTTRLIDRDCDDEDLNDIGQRIFSDLDGEDHGDDQKNDEQYLIVDYQFVPC